MAETTTPISNAEDFSHAVLCVLEGAPENWDSDARAEERRMATSRQLEAWYDAHALVPANEKAREVARNELQDVIELASLAYHQRGRTAAERAKEAQQREEFVGLLSATIEEVLHGHHATVTLEEIETISADVTKEAKASALDDGQTAMMRIMAFASTCVQRANDHVQRGVSDLHRLNDQLEEHAPKVHRALQKSEHILRDPLPHLRKQLDSAYDHIKEHQPVIASFITQSPALKAMVLGAMLYQGISNIGQQFTQTGSAGGQDRASLGIALIDSEKGSTWAPYYANYVQSHLKDSKGTHFNARKDAEGVMRVGFGTNMDSKEAKAIFHLAGVDYDAVRAGKMDVTQDQAIRLLHMRAEYFANDRAGVTLSYTDRIGVMNDTWGKEVMKDLKPWYREPEKFAFHEAKPEKRPHSHVTSVQKNSPKHTGKFAQKYSYKSTREAHTDGQKIAFKENGTKVITANVQLSANPNAYMSKPLLEETVALLKEVPHDRDFGNPNDPGSQKFYDALMVVLKGAEGFSDVMYYCSAHKPTIGYGCRLDLKENQRTIQDLFGDKYSIQALMNRTQRIDMEDARKLAHTMLAEKESELMEWMGPEAYAAMPEGHKGAVNDANYNGGHGRRGLVGLTLRRQYREGDYDGALKTLNDDSNGNNMKSLGDRRTFNVGMAMLDAEVSADSKQTARIIDQTVKLHVSSIKPRKIKELVVNLGVPKIDEILEHRLTKSNAIKEALRRGADVVIAADSDTLIAHADTRGKIEFKDYSHTDRLLAEDAQPPSKDGFER